MKDFKCTRCGRICKSEQGLKAHQRFCVPDVNLDETVQQVDEYLKTDEELLQEEIVAYVESLKGLNRMSLDQANKGIDLYTRRFGQSPGSPTCPQCLKHMYKCLLVQTQ